MSSTDEYAYIREELQSVKDCITRYTGYLLGGSGAAVLTLSALYQLAIATEGRPLLATGIGCLALSLLPPLVYLILLYKFNSHNRFAAYCRLLSHERPFHNSEASPTQILSWEYCMSELRECELKADLWPFLWKRAKFRNMEATLAQRARDRYGPIEVPESDVRKRQPIPRDPFGKDAEMYARRSRQKKPRIRADRGARRWAAVILLKCLFGWTRSYSWTFPAHVTALFLWVTAGFFLSGSALLWIDVQARNIPLALGLPNDIEGVAFTAWFGVAVTHAAVWYLFGVRMYSLLHGSATVTAYSWRFLPIRVAFLNDRNIVPSYVGLSEPESPLVLSPKTGH